MQNEIDNKELGAPATPEPATHERSRSTASPPNGECQAQGHTPLPWGLSYGFSLSAFPSSQATYVAGPDPKMIGIKIATPWVDGAWDEDEEAAANAEFIVRACNAHYSLAGALAEIVGQVEQARDGFGIWPYDGSKSMATLLESAKAILASVDTRPKGGDAPQSAAPFTGSAVPQGDATPTPRTGDQSND